MAMIRLCVIGLTSFLAVAILLCGQKVEAISQNLVISQIKLGDAASVKNEFVEIHNNSENDIEITNWCLYYVTTSQTASKMVCFTSTSDTFHLYLPGHSTMLAVSNEQMAAATPIQGDFHFAATLSGVGGNIRLQNELGNEIDTVGWGSSTPELNLATPAPAGSVLQRKILSGDLLKDTDINSVDFEIVPPRDFYQFGMIREVQDVCANLNGVQASLPVGYVMDGGNCVLPAVDFCPNLEGLQTTLPIGMKKEGEGCFLIPLQISEILPNAVGSDLGGEFIEIYNPNNTEIDLKDYVLYIGPNYSHAYQFPANTIIKPGQYGVYYNNDINFTLLNTTGSVRLETTDNLLISETPIYSNPPEGFSWAVVDGIWQFTNALTPGNLNKISVDLDDNELLMAEALMSCSAGQERNPSTNRCRKIASSSSVLMPCKDGQYRSEETNRCRSILNDVSSLAVCAEGQERNPKTNRCRSVMTNASATLEPCKEGQERNPETNRCRNISKMIKANYTPERSEPASANFGWWVLGGVGIVAIGYGIWEWRYEIIRLWQKVSLFIRRKK